MAMTDPIADMLTRIRNAGSSSRMSVSMSDSKIKREIARVLKEEGYIKDYATDTTSSKPMLNIVLKYYDGKPVIETLCRVSKPGRRVYRKLNDMPIVNSGLGITIVSTSKGVMTVKAARKMQIGGEIVCTVS